MAMLSYLDEMLAVS